MLMVPSCSRRLDPEPQGRLPYSNSRRIGTILGLWALGSALGPALPMRVGASRPTSLQYIARVAPVLVRITAFSLEAGTDLRAAHLRISGRSPAPSMAVLLRSFSRVDSPSVPKVNDGDDRAVLAQKLEEELIVVVIVGRSSGPLCLHSVGRSGRSVGQSDGRSGGGAVGRAVGR